MVEQLTERVVLVDDEPNIRETVAFILEAEGVEVETAGDGMEGLEAVRRCRPRVVLLDVMMPRLDGYEVCREIRRDPDLDGALFRSANGGVTWTRLMMESEDEWEHAPLVARLWDSEDTLFAVAGDKVWGSHDGGRSWVTLADGIPQALALAPAL